ncbi:uncharacterized protein EV154DRAFT_513935 [Mucor mucedo]|uniref:uncharacterized protein n=1 Tax=Mucor mucedo TaxID=29922 RepID=UPI00221F4946|nr:uncharacterized protein EV154DRAFT_513935 [Mucor mucedo]KAI7889631.1 hypothetical protein EV154DRAFT_513935 [Mucor mucedo]
MKLDKSPSSSGPSSPRGLHQDNLALPTTAHAALEQQQQVSPALKLDKTLSSTQPIGTSSPFGLDQSKCVSSSTTSQPSVTVKLEQKQQMPTALELDKTPSSSGSSRNLVNDQGKLATSSTQSVNPHLGHDMIYSNPIQFDYDMIFGHNNPPLNITNPYVAESLHEETMARRSLGELPVPSLDALPPMDEVLDTLASLNKDSVASEEGKPSTSPSVASPAQPQGKSKVGRKKAARQKKAELKKKRAMELAARRHNDLPKKSDELDFDALLRQHEAASTSVVQPSAHQQQHQRKPAQPAQQKHQQSGFAPQSNPVKAPKAFNRPQQKGIEPQRPFQQKKFVPTVVCKYYMQGTCRQGSNCTFKHDGKPPPAPTARIVCQFYKTGSCTQGEDCKFSHDLKLEPCRFFHMQRDCTQGEYCPYSHEPLNKDRLERLRLLTGHCRFYLFKGFCNTGDECLFLHSDATEEERKKVEATITACRYFHLTKNCRQGDNCFYLHSEATPEQVRSLSK